jgi:exodeoxyribonuclease V gamma subunit
LLKKTAAFQKESLKEYFKEQNTFLANNGRVYQLFSRFLEDNNIPYEECYESPCQDHLLGLVQQEMLFLEKYDKPQDDSIQIHSATSKLREVEVVWEIIQRLGTSPSQILIYAPDIMEYVPYIHMVFGRKENPYEYTIFDLELENESSLAGSLKNFLDLPSSNFDVDSILKLLSFSNFLQKWQLADEDVEVIKKWTKEARIYFDIYSQDPGSWDVGLSRLIEALINGRGRVNIELSQADLLGKWIEIIQAVRLAFNPIVKLEKKRVAEWMIYIQKMAEQFFAVHEDDEAILKEFFHLGKIEAGPFTFTSISRVLEQVFKRREGSFHGSYLNSVRFCSLKPGTSFPAESIILMGMEDGVFPRVQLRTSLEEVVSKQSITVAEEDRYLFLEQFLCARSYFILTYTRIDKQDGKDNPPSLLVQELMRYLPNVHIHFHPREPFDESYFQETGFRSYSPFYFAAAKKNYQEKFPRMPIFSMVPSLTLQDVPTSSLDMRSLSKLARHPIQFYFEKNMASIFNMKNLLIKIAFFLILI